jgi:hypothetical protein
LRLPFSLVRFFWASKRNEQIRYGQAKEMNKYNEGKHKNRPKANEQITL